MKRFPVIVSLGLSLVMTSTAWGTTVKLRLMETSNINMHLLDYDYSAKKETPEFGFARTVTLIKNAREEAENNLLFDNGNALQGSPMANWVARNNALKMNEVHPTYKVMNALQYDAATLGNQDFDFGIPFLLKAIRSAGFPYVSANLLESHYNHPFFAPYALLPRDFKDADGKMQRLTVGVLGLISPQLMKGEKSRQYGNVTAINMAEAAHRYVPVMKKEGANIVVVVAQAGLLNGAGKNTKNTEIDSLTAVPGVDAVLLGASNDMTFPSTVFKSMANANIDQGTINGVPVVMPARWGKSLGLIDLSLEKQSGVWKVKQAKSFVRTVYDEGKQAVLAVADPMVHDLVGMAQQATLTYSAPYKVAPKLRKKR